MKETQTKKRKVSKGVKRARNMRNMVMMVLVCVLMLSAATYAWFTLSDTAKITNLTMTVGEETALLIAPDKNQGQATGEADTYGSTLPFGTDATNAYKIPGKLLPATLTATDADIQKPKYEDNKVTAVEALDDNEDIMNSESATDDEFYCYKTTFYLKNGGTQEKVYVSLKKGEYAQNTSNTDGTADATSGTYMKNQNSGKAATAIRVRLVSADGGTVIYQPLSDVTVTTTSESATDARGDGDKVVAALTDKQKYDGTFDTNATQGKLVVSNAGTRITMEIWLEGTDKYCVNEIMADQIAGQLAFEVVGEVTP